MALSSAQKATLKAAIAANTTVAGGSSAYASTPINQIPNNSDGNQAIAAWYNGSPTPDFFVWNSQATIASVYDNVTWANLTPTDAPDGTQTWANRSLACQGKQFNLQTILIGAQGIVNATKSSIRAGLQDALSNVPSGVGGATISAGWANVRDKALARKAMNIEKLFADTAGGNGATAQNSALPVFDGAISPSDVDTARNS